MRFLRRLSEKAREIVSSQSSGLVPLTFESIQAAESDEALLRLLSDELLRLIPRELDRDYDALAKHLQTLPRGLRAMAGVHRLDISLSLDSLVEHFANFPGILFAEETLLGLRELELNEFAELFENALTAVAPFGAKYSIEQLPQGIKNQLLAITQQMWDIQNARGIYSLMDSWAPYARKHPDRVLTR